MSALVDKLLAKGHDAADHALERHGAERYYDLLEALRKRLPTEADAVRDPHKQVMRNMGLDGLSRLERAAPQAVGLGRAALTVLMSYIASGDLDEAQRQYLRLQAPPQALVKAVLAAGGDAVAERQARETLEAEAKAAGKYLVEEIGPLAARYLLPMLLLTG